jgi:hypothetical protein
MGLQVHGGCSADKYQRVNHQPAPFSTAHAHFFLRDEPLPEVACCCADGDN